MVAIRMLTHDSQTLVADPPGSDAALKSPEAQLILALDRLFKVGPYYPPGHAATRRVTSDFLAILARVLDGRDFAVLGIRQAHLHLLGQPLDKAWPGVADFETLLLELGIDHLEIDAKASVEDLLTFVARFLAFRNEVAGVKHFKQMKYEGLPPTVRVGEKHFQTGIAIGSTGLEEEGATDATGEAVEAQPTPAAAQPVPAAADDATGERGPHAPEPDAEAAEAPGFAGTNFESSGPVLVAAPPRLAENKKPVAQGLEKLIGNLEDSENRDIRSRALESVELMIRKLGRDGRNSSRHADFLGTESESAKERQVRILQQADSPELKPPKPGDPLPPEKYDMSMDELRGALSDYAGRAVEMKYHSELDETEHLSIMLQMLKDKQPPDVLAGVERNLHTVLKRRLQDNEREVCVAGVVGLLQESDDGANHRGLALVLDCFRRSRIESAIALISDVCERCQDEQAPVIWPFAVNQLLLGDDSHDTRRYRALCHRAGTLPVETMRAQVETLRKLEAIKKNRFNEDVVQPPLQELYPVFAVLMEASHPGPLAVKLVRGLKYAPPNPVGEIVLPLIDTYRHGYREFLIALLTEEPGTTASPPLLEAAGRILSSELLGLSPKRRDEAWVPETIAALADFPVPEVDRILKTVLKRRFLFLINTWPKACRQAAQDAERRLHVARLAAEAAREAEEDPERAFTSFETETRP